MAGDPYWSDVVFAAHFDSSTTCSKGNAPSSVGVNATISTTRSVFGGASLSLPNLINSAVHYAAGAPDVDFGSGDFCIDGWIYATRLNSVALRIPGVVMEVSSGQFFVGVSLVGVGNRNISGAGSIANQGWLYFAIERWGDTVYAYLGNSIGGTANVGSSALDTSGVLTGLSLNYVDSYRIGGNIDDLRITPRARLKGTPFVPSEAFAEFYDPPAVLAYWD